MWIITVFNTDSKENSVTMFEFDNEKEAREHFKTIHGCKILSEVIYGQTPSLALAYN